jgi:hypothetical protein
MGLDRKLAIAAFLVLLVVGGWSIATCEEPADVKIHDLSALADAQVWELAAGDQTIHAERRGEVLAVATLTSDGQLGDSLLTCVAGTHRCAARVETWGEFERILLVKEGTDEREEVLLEVHDGRLELVAGSRATRVGSAVADQGALSPADQMPRDEILLVCPEGDSFMRLESADADGEYFCERHGLPLERAGDGQATPLPASGE